MTCFAIDAYGRSAGVCVLQQGKMVFSRVLNQGLTHSETLLPLVQQAMAEAGIAPPDIDAYGITVGPGSFTGLRIGLALIKGLSLPFATPVAPVSTLHALALGSGLSGSVVAALNARRGEVYWAAFTCGQTGCERLTPDAAQPVTALEETLCALQGPISLVGDGATLCMDAFAGQYPVKLPPEETRERAAYGAALLAAEMLQKGTVVPAAAANPEYLRLSQAERERQQRMQAQER